MAKGFRITVDISEVLKGVSEERNLTGERVIAAVQGLAAQTHAFILDKAQTGLRSRREAYVKALYFEPIEDNMWIVGLRPEALWIEDGKQPGSMVDDLLHQSGPNSSPAKRARDGSLYRVIPMDQAGPPSTTPSSKQSLAAAVRSELRKHKIPLKKIETGPDGRPKMGLLHSLDIESPKSKSGIPLLQGVRVYQRMVEKTIRGKKTRKPQRDIVTFRVVSSKHKESGLWFHPGLAAKNYFDEAYEWAMKEWETSIEPSLRKGSI